MQRYAIINNYSLIFFITENLKCPTVTVFYSSCYKDLESNTTFLRISRPKGFKKKWDKTCSSKLLFCFNNCIKDFVQIVRLFLFISYMLVYKSITLAETQNIITQI